MVDINKLDFYSGTPIDKIVASGTISFTHNGAVTYTDSTYVNAPIPSVSFGTVPNTYGEPLMIRAVYSIDGGLTWNSTSLEKQFVWSYPFYFEGYGFVGTNYTEYPQIKISVGCNNNNIIARAYGGYLTGAILNGYYTSGLSYVYSGWTPISQNIIVKYWAYEL